jgi:catecholate siderophore receptor
MTAKPKKRTRTRRKKHSPYWFAIGAMGSVVAHTAAGGRLVPAAYGARLAAGQSLPVAVFAQAQGALRFDIPPGLLDGVIEEFEEITGLDLVLSRTGIGSLPSPGVVGELAPERALRQILAGTGVTFRYTASSTITLDLSSVSESIDVTAAPPPVATSSTKYTEPLRDIPQTIQVIPQDVIETQGVATLSDALRNVPGITLQAGEGGGASNTAGDMFNMRGFSANNSIFVDGVRDDGLISRDVFNLEQVEVFLGPTGSDVGRGTAAGYVNMQSKTPKPLPAYSGSYEYGSADRKRFTADFNAPLELGAPGSWLSHSAFRLNGLWQDGGVAGRDVVEFKSQAVAPSLALGLGTPTRVTLASEVMRQNNVPDYGIPGSAYLEAALSPTTVRASNPVRQSNYYGSIGYDNDKVSQNNYTVRLERDVNDRLTLRNQTRYNKTHRTAVISTAQSPTSFNPATQLVTIARQGNERENRIVSNQSTMTARFSTGGLPHASTSGVEYSSERQFAPTLTGLGTRSPVDIYSPNPHDPITGFAPARTAAFNRGRTSTIALYGFDTVNIGERWQLSGGIRWEHYTTDFRAADASAATTTDQHAADGIFSGKAALLFRATSQANVYVSYGTSVTPPGTANFTLSAQPNNQNNPNVKPQASKNYEIGSKWDFFGGRLSFTIAAFRTDNKNVIFTVDATAVPPIYNQDDAQRVNGFTVGTVGRITRRIQVLGNFSYLDSSLQTQNSANSGRRLTLTPLHSGSLWMTCELPGRVTVGGGIRYTDAVSINSANTIQSPGYHVGDALIEYEVNKHLSFRVNVYNVADAAYIRNVNNNGGRYNPGNPRSITFTPKITF